MAQYNIEKEVKEIAEFLNITPEEAAEKIGFFVSCGDWTTAWNRSDEAKVKDFLNNLKRTKRENEIRKERIEGYRWVSEFDGWVVAGDFTGKEIGDKITVTKANGSRQEKVIVSFTNRGNAKVF